MKKQTENSRRNVHNLIILDESGSMNSIKKATLSGFNELVENIRSLENKFPEQTHFVSLFTFNSSGIKTKHFAEPAKTLKPLTDEMFQPEAMTPLYDAVGFSVNELRRRIETERGTNVLVTIFTDGEENSSMEYDRSAIRSLVQNHSTRGWTFTYIGTNHDVDAAADDIGVSQVLYCVSDQRGIKSAFDKDKQARQNYANKLRRGDDFARNYFED